MSRDIAEVCSQVLATAQGLGFAKSIEVSVANVDLYEWDEASHSSKMSTKQHLRVIIEPWVMAGIPAGKSAATYFVEADRSCGFVPADWKVVVSGEGVGAKFALDPANVEKFLELLSAIDIKQAVAVKQKGARDSSLRKLQQAVEALQKSDSYTALPLLVNQQIDSLKQQLDRGTLSPRKIDSTLKVLEKVIAKAREYYLHFAKYCEDFELEKATGTKDIEPPFILRKLCVELAELCDGFSSRLTESGASLEYVDKLQHDLQLRLRQDDKAGQIMLQLNPGSGSVPGQHFRLMIEKSVAGSNRFYQLLKKNYQLLLGPTDTKPHEFDKGTTEFLVIREVFFKDLAVCNRAVLDCAMISKRIKDGVERRLGIIPPAVAEDMGKTFIDFGLFGNEGSADGVDYEGSADGAGAAAASAYSTKSSR